MGYLPTQPLQDFAIPKDYSNLMDMLLGQKPNGSCQVYIVPAAEVDIKKQSATTAYFVSNGPLSGVYYTCMPANFSKAAKSDEAQREVLRQLSTHNAKVIAAMLSRTGIETYILDKI